MSKPILHLLTEEVIKRFWDKVWIRNEDECWPFVGGRNSWNYGVFHIIQDGGTNAQVVAWVITNRKDVGHGLLIRHTCNYPPCCNPKHLLIGTHDQNMQDRLAAGNYGKGENNPNSRLSNIDIQEIRKLLRQSQISPKRIAELYGVSRSLISKIKLNQTWKN